MKFRVRCRLDYALHSPATLIFLCRASRTPPQSLSFEHLALRPDAPAELVVTPPAENRFDRVSIARASTLSLTYEAGGETACRRVPADSLRRAAPGRVQADHLPFLLPSRYCQSDRLGRLAWRKFGSIRNPYDQVLGITRWIHENVEYLPGITTSMTSAYDTVTQCAGVCRDFAHLGIALCRALAIPARYVAAYSPKLALPDFHACFEVFIAGQWLLFDATQKSPPDALIRIGTGRDAADVSVCTAFGMVTLTFQEVRCECLDGGLHGIGADEMETTAISFDPPRR